MQQCHLGMPLPACFAERGSLLEGLRWPGLRVAQRLTHDSFENGTPAWGILRAPERLAESGGARMQCDFGDTNPHLNGRVGGATLQARAMPVSLLCARVSLRADC